MDDAEPEAPCFKCDRKRFVRNCEGCRNIINRYKSETNWYGSQKTKNGRVRTKAAMTRTKTPQCTDCRGTGWACNKGTRGFGRCKWNERDHVQRWHNKKCPNGCRQRC